MAAAQAGGSAGMGAEDVPVAIFAFPMFPSDPLREEQVWMILNIAYLLGSGALAVNDRFRLQEFSESDFTPFASVPGHLITTERGFWIFGGSVDENHAGFKPSSNIVRALLASGLYIGS